VPEFELSGALHNAALPGSKSVHARSLAKVQVWSVGFDLATHQQTTLKVTGLD